MDYQKVKKKDIQMIRYDDLIDIDKIEDVYHTIRVNTKHKNKLVKFEVFLTSNFINILELLKNRNFTHSKYNIFLITEPKHRIIMSECMTDKIINHLVSKYVLFKVVEPRLIDMNIATRKGKGTKAGIYYIKKYINTLKINNDKFYALKCDIHKFFYSIDHKILFSKLDKVIEDKEIMDLIKKIVTSTDSSYVNEKIKREVNNEKLRVSNLNISLREKELLYERLNGIPLYDKGKGLPIGNMTSQIMAIFYLNDLDHFIKEKLRCKYYVRYMDDMLIFSPDKNYLKFCLKEIEKKLWDLKLRFNNKTQIYDVSKGFNFLGYRFILKGKKLYTLINRKAKRRIKKRWKGEFKSDIYLPRKSSYNGYLINANTSKFTYQNYTSQIRKHNIDVYKSK